jgi:hypothetical protein
MLGQENTDHRDVDRARPLCVRAAARMGMTREVAPRACHHTETLLRYLRMRTPNVLIVPMSRLVWT